MKTKLIFFFTIVCSFTMSAQKWTQYNAENTESCIYSNNINSIAIESQGSKWFGTDQGVSKFDGISWTNYTTANGLINNYVNVIVIDSLGNKWIGTRGGVSKFGDTNWTSYTTTNGLINNFINAIAIDSSGCKWFGTNGGVSKFDGITWTNYTTANGLINNNVNAIVIDSLGNKWFGTNAGISKFDGTNWVSYTSSNGIASNYVWKIALDGEGNIWLGRLNQYIKDSVIQGGVSKYNGKTWVNYTKDDGLCSTNVYSIAIDAKGNKWFGTDKGISKFDGSSWTSSFSNYLIKAIGFDNLGIAWYGVWGLGVLKFNDTTFTTYQKSGLDNSVSSIAIDAQDNKWFGDGRGVSKFDGTNWTRYNLVVNSSAIDPKGNKWFATTYYGVYKFNDTVLVHYSTSNGLATNYINCIATDRKGDIWAGSNVGISKFDGISWTNYTPANGAVYSIAIDHEDNLWAAMYGAVLKFDGTNWITYTTLTNGFAGSGYNAIAIDAYNNKWFVGWGWLGGDPNTGVVSKFDGTNCTNYKFIGPIRTSANNVIAIDSLGNIWVGSLYYGLYKFNGSRWTHFTSANNGMIPFDRGYGIAIAIDAYNNKWFGVSSYGVLKLEDKDIHLSKTLINVSDTVNSMETFEIKSNTNWNVSCDQSWLTINRVSGSNNATITLTASANISNSTRTAILTISGDSIMTDTVKVIQAAIPTSIKENVNDNVILYPSPITNRMYISLSKPSTETNLYIYTINGILLYSSKIYATKTEIDMSNYVAGVYIVKIVTSDNNILIKKIIKQ